MARALLHQEQATAQSIIMNQVVNRIRHQRQVDQEPDPLQ